MEKHLLETLYVSTGLSQRAVAKKLGVSQSTVRYYLAKYDIKKNLTCPETSGGSKKCPRCQIIKPKTDFYKRNRDGARSTGSWCKKCMSEQVTDRQRRYKNIYVKQKGGKCQLCGFDKYNGALEFHHKDPTKKDSRMSKMTRMADSAEVQRELEKCILLCANCHRMTHAGLTKYS